MMTTTTEMIKEVMRAGTEARRMRMSREYAVLVDMFLYFLGIFSFFLG